jgi:hypothetical protein
LKKIPASHGIDCQNGCSGKAIAYYNGIPYCAECLHEEQQLKWDRDGNFFVNSEGERVYFEIVRRLS